MPKPAFVKMWHASASDCPANSHRAELHDNTLDPCPGHESTVELTMEDWANWSEVGQAAHALAGPDDCFCGASEDPDQPNHAPYCVRMRQALRKVGII